MRHNGDRALLRGRGIVHVMPGANDARQGYGKETTTIEPTEERASPMDQPYQDFLPTK